MHSKYAPDTMFVFNWKRVLEDCRWSLIFENLPNQCYKFDCTTKNCKNEQTKKNIIDICAHISWVFFVKYSEGFSYIYLTALFINDFASKFAHTQYVTYKTFYIFSCAESPQFFSFIPTKLQVHIWLHRRWWIYIKRTTEIHHLTFTS